MERCTRVLIAGALAGLLTLPASLALAQQQEAATAPPTPLRALKIADRPAAVPPNLALAQATATPPRPPGSSMEAPAVVPPPASVTPPGAEAIPPSGGRYSDPQSGAQGDGQTGGPQSTSEPPKGTSLPPIAPPEASGKN